MKRLSIKVTILFLSTFLLSFSQTDKRKNIFPIWTFHQDSINIHGVSIGLFSFDGKPSSTYTNGVRIELIGVGLIIPLIPKSPIAENDSSFLKLKQQPISERVNGINLSATGTACNCLINGVSLGLIGQITFQINGFSSSLFMAYSQIHNGIQIAAFTGSYYMNGLQIGVSNYANYANGLQIGLFNYSENLKGLQIGLWNVNQKRKFPIINWSF
jgi:hypothetical protein